MNLIEWLRNLGAVNEQRARDSRRRSYQGTRERFERSGAPAPVPVFQAPPRPGAQRSGIETAAVLGNGAAVYVDIDGSSTGTWIYHTVYSVVAGAIESIDTDHYVTAMNGATVLATVMVSDHLAAPGASHNDANYARVPSSRLRLVVLNSTNLVYYQITGIWEEDR